MLRKISAEKESVKNLKASRILLSILILEWIIDNENRRKNIRAAHWSKIDI